jgi:hypothetical protein
MVVFRSITDVGLATLAKNCRQLRKLKIMDTILTDQGIKVSWMENLSESSERSSRYDPYRMERKSEDKRLSDKIEIVFKIYVHMCRQHEYEKNLRWLLFGFIFISSEVSFVF